MGHDQVTAFNSELKGIPLGIGVDSRLNDNQDSAAAVTGFKVHVSTLVSLVRSTRRALRVCMC
jgi:hypothetical protein